LFFPHVKLLRVSKKGREGEFRILGDTWMESVRTGYLFNYNAAEGGVGDEEERCHPSCVFGVVG